MKYEVVADDLKTKIQAGTYRPGDQLPPIEKLCELYSVSKITVKKALDELEGGGLISRRRGSGSFVKNIKPMLGGKPGQFETSGQMGGFVSEQAAHGFKVETQVKEFKVELPPAETATYLDLDADQFCYRVVRVRFSNGEAHAVEYTYMPIDVIPNLRAKTLEHSIYSYIEDELGLKISSAHRLVRAVLPTKDEQEWLGVSANSPLLEIEQVGFLDDGAPFEYSISRHPNGYEFRTVSVK